MQRLLTMYYITLMHASNESSSAAMDAESQGSWGAKSSSPQSTKTPA